MLEEIKPGIFAEKATNNPIRMFPATLIGRALEKNLPNVLTLDQIERLLGKKYSEALEFENNSPEIPEEDRYEFLAGITSRKKLRIAHDDSLDMVIEKEDFKNYLVTTANLWPLPKDCLLSNWWPDGECKKSIYERREADCDKWLKDTGVDIKALSDINTLEQLQARNHGLWKSLKGTSFRSEFYTEYSKKRGINKKPGPKSK